MGQDDQVRYDLERVKGIYAETYASFLALPGFAAERKFLNHRFRLVMKLAGVDFSFKWSYLDLGCGLGIKTRIVSEHFDQSVGVDFVERCVQVANLLNDRPGLEFIQADATKPMGRRFHFASAFGLSVFNVSDGEDCARAIKKAMDDYLEPGGVMMVYSFTDFSGKAPSGWVNHKRSDLDQIAKAFPGKAKVIFPHRHAGNYFGNGSRHMLTELAKLFSRKRRDYYIVIERPQAANG